MQGCSTFGPLGNLRVTLTIFTDKKAQNKHDDASSIGMVGRGAMFLFLSADKPKASWRAENPTKSMAGRNGLLTQPCPENPKCGQKVGGGHPHARNPRRRQRQDNYYGNKAHRQGHKPELTGTGSPSTTTRKL